MGKTYYTWYASSDNGCFEDSDLKIFENKCDCYNDMRNAALEKMKWNTQFAEDFEDGVGIGYEVKFSPNKITHKSYSGTYTYEIHKLVEVDKKYGLTLYDEIFGMGKGKMWIVPDNRRNSHFYFNYDENEYSLLDMEGALTCKWRYQVWGDTYILIPMLTFQNTIEVGFHKYSETEFSRLVWLNTHNKGYDGVALVSVNADGRSISVANLLDIRNNGLANTLKNSVKTYHYESREDVEPIKNEELHWGERAWKKVKELPIRENTWKVIETEEFALWMDNEYGEMYLCKDDNIYKNSF